MTWICLCGARNEGNYCGQCGQKYQAAAESQQARFRREPKGPKRWALPAGVLLALVAALGFAVASRDCSAPKESESAAHDEPSPAPTAAQGTPGSQRGNRDTASSDDAPYQAPPFPDDERSLIGIVSQYRDAYQAAANEFQKSSLRRERAQAIARIFDSPGVTHWVGFIEKMETTHEGNGVLSLLISPFIRIETTNNGLSESLASLPTLIPQGSRLYADISKLSVGTTVTFSGSFAPSRLDYFAEESVTEEGSMKDPEFLFAFTEVSAGVVESTNALPQAPAALSDTELDGLRVSRKDDMQLIAAIHTVLSAPTVNDSLTAYCSFTAEQMQAMFEVAGPHATDAEKQWTKDQNVGVCRARLITGLDKMPSPPQLREYLEKAERDVAEIDRKLSSSPRSSAETSSHPDPAATTLAAQATAVPTTSTSKFTAPQASPRAVTPADPAQSQILYQENPTLTEAAARANFRGSVQARVSVDADGHLYGVKILNPPGYGMSARIIGALYKWKFKPLVRNGVQVPFSGTVTFTFGE
jgi:Gram-negative bacterial TonB protein C-terminal